MGRQIIPVRDLVPFFGGTGPRSQQEDNETNSMCIGRCNDAEKAKKEGQRKQKFKGPKKRHNSCIKLKARCANKR